MKVLVLATHYNKGGAEKQLGHIALELARNGAILLHVSIAKQMPPNIPENKPSCRYQSLGVTRFRSLQFFQSILKLFQTEKPDIILSCITPCDFMAFLWTRFNCCKWVMREPNTYVDAKKESPWALRRWLGRYADAVISNNQGGYEFWEKTRQGRSTHLVSNLIYADLVQASAKNHSRQMIPEKPYYVCVGRLEEQKNFLQALRGFAYFARENPGYCLCIVGSGSQLDLLKTEAENLRIFDSVIFTGYLSNPLPTIRASKGLILPSHYEGCPNVAMEAAVLGIPLLLSDIPAHRAVFHEDSVFYFPLNQPRSTSECINRSLNSRHQPDFHQLKQEWNAKTNGRKYYEILKKISSI